MSNLTRRFYNREALDKMDFSFPIFEEGEPVTSETPKVDETKKTMFGTKENSTYVTKNDSDEIIILKNASKSDQKFFVEIKSSNKTTITAVAKCSQTKNDNEFKLKFFKTEKYQLEGTMLLTPKIISDIQVLKNNYLRIVLSTKALTIG